MATIDLEITFRAHDHLAQCEAGQASLADFETVRSPVPPTRACSALGHDAPLPLHVDNMVALGSVSTAPATIGL